MYQETMLLLVNVIFLGVILHSLSKRTKLLLRVKIINSKKVILLIGSILLLGIVIYLGRSWEFYVTGIMGVIAYICSSIFDGITENGIQARRSLLIYTQSWEGLSRIKLLKGDYLTLDYTGNKSSNFLYFEREDYDKLMKILNNSLKEDMKENISE